MHALDLSVFTAFVVVHIGSRVAALAAMTWAERLGAKQDAAGETDEVEVLGGSALFVGDASDQPALWRSVLIV